MTPRADDPARGRGEGRDPSPHDARAERPAPPIRNAYWLPIPGQMILAGEYPGGLDEQETRERLRSLLDAGITCFVDLTGGGWEWLKPYEPLLREEAHARGVDVSCHRLTIEDLGVPDVEQMREILDLIRRAAAGGRAVYIHCHGGVGRTGTVVGCHLVRHGWSGEAALAEVARLFATMSPSKVRQHPEGSPQTPAQRAMVRTWSEGEAGGQD